MLENYIAIIQAGGKGTRLRELTKDEIPKPLLKLNGKPMIEWQLENVKRYGITEFVLITGFLGEKIEKYFGDGSQWGVNITYVRENEPLGSAGALYYLKERLENKNFLLIFGDVLFDVDLRYMVNFYEEHAALATLAVHPNTHPQDSDLVVLDRGGQVIGFDAKSNVRDYWYKNLVNAGLYVLSGSLLEGLDNPKKIDLEKDLLVPNIETGRIYGYHTTEYIKDAGTPERFAAVSIEQRQGLWKKKNLGNQQKCIFLDRDGTINIYRGLIADIDMLELEKNAAEAVRLINASGYLAIVVTNQPVVARGLCMPEDVELIHKKLETLLGNQGAYLDEIVYCPHHPDKGFPEENEAYKIRCSCRKPGIGMIERMSEKYNIDLSKSYIIGDSTVDIQTGKNAGLKTVLVKTGQAGEDGKYEVKADYEVCDILEAVKLIAASEEEI